MFKLNTSTGFIIAGLYNLFGILIFSHFFTNPLLSQYDPVVFSWLGQVSILLWGLAYIAVSQKFWEVPYIVLVFAVEKSIYVYVWADWLIGESNRLSELTSHPMTAIFFSIYGIGDLISGIFFAYVTYKTLRKK